MRTISRLALLGIAIHWHAAFAAADEPLPLTVTLQPQMLVLSPTAKIDLRCELTNTSEKPIVIDWDPRYATMFPRQINLRMFDGSMGRKYELTAGESLAFPIALKLGEDLPALDEGDYDLAINFAINVQGTRRHMQKRFPLTIVHRDGEKPATTAESLAAAAREFAKMMGGEKIDLESYLIRRRGNGWEVELSLRGPTRFGSMTVSLDADGKGAHVLPIP